MRFLRAEKIKPALWLFVLVSWILGFTYGRWVGTSESVLELSKIVRVTLPTDMSIWWEVLIYFALSTVSVFVLSHILFGIGGAVFLFARGMYDSSLIAYMETTVGGWSFMNLPGSEISMVTITTLIVAVNLPLCLWSGQLGTQRSIYTLYRLRDEPVNPDFGTEPFSKLPIIISISLIAGLVATVLFPYA